MTKKEVIESGMLEQYVLGLLDSGEESEVQKWINTYPSLRDHLLGMEEMMEQIAIEESIPPPPHVRDNIIEKVNPPVGPTKPGYDIWKIAGWAAAIILLAASGILWNEGQATQYSLEAERNSLSMIKADCDVKQEELDKTLRLLSLYEGEQYETHSLQGTGDYSVSRATVFWSDSDKKAYLNCLRFPSAPDGHTYQIWSDVDGQMLSSGVFSGDTEVIEIKYYERATSLNITIEEGSGSDHPDVSRLIMNKQV